MLVGQVTRTDASGDGVGRSAVMEVILATAAPSRCGTVKGICTGSYMLVSGKHAVCL
jgi:hypothetical protein